MKVFEDMRERVWGRDIGRERLHAIDIISFNLR